MSNKKITKTALLASLCLVLGYIETLFPLSLGVPGIKLGLANLAVVWALYTLGTKSAFFVAIIKIFVSLILFKGFSSFAFATFGGLLSFLVMAIFKKSKHISIVGVSTLGGVFHNIGQIISSFLVLKTTATIYYLPPLLISGAVTGFLIGSVSRLLTKYIKLENEK